MTPQQAKQVVVFGITIAALITVFEEISKPEIPKLRVGFGALFAGVLLSLTADVAPKIAATFAALIAVSSVLSNGAVFDKIGKVVATK